MSIRLEQIQEACDRRLDQDELDRLRQLVFDLHAPDEITVSTRTLFSLIGSYERSHYEPGATDYASRLRGLLGEAVEPTRKARDLASQRKHRVDEGYLEAALALLRNAQKQAL